MSEAQQQAAQQQAAQQRAVQQQVQAQMQAKQSRRGALWLLVPVAVGVAVGVALALTRLDDATLGPAAAPGGASGVAAVGAYDPEGDRHENSEAVGRATDGDPATYWETETYRDFRSLKSGVGLVLEAEGATELLVRSETPGFTARIDAGAEAGGPFETLAAEQQIGDATSFDLGDAGAPYVVLWITQLPQGVARINEVEAR